MDEVGLAQQYYIEKSSSPADEQTRVLKYGKMFAVFDRHGDMGPSGRDRSADTPARESLSPIIPAATPAAEAQLV